MIMLFHGQTNTVSIAVDMEKGDFLDIIQSVFAIWEQIHLCRFRYHVDVLSIILAFLTGCEVCSTISTG